MIKQTRGAIRFLLADYRAVLKYAMIAAAGIALSSPSYAGEEGISEGATSGVVSGGETSEGNTESQDTEVISADTKYAQDKDFNKKVNVQKTLTLENGNYTAKSVYVNGINGDPHVKGELVVRDATLTTSENNGMPDKGTHVMDPVFVMGKLSLTNATVTSRDNGEPAGVQLWGSDAEAAFAGKVKIDGDLGIGIGKDQGDLNIVLDGKDTNGTYTDLDLTVNGEISIDRASLTLKGYDKAEGGPSQKTTTTVTARGIVLGRNGGQLTVGHNASMETQGLYIENNVEGKQVEAGAVKVENGGTLKVTGNGNYGKGSDNFFAVENYKDNGDGDEQQEVKDLKGIIKAANSSEIVFSHRAAVDYKPVTMDYGEDGKPFSYVPDQAFDIDNTSKLTISDLGAMTKAEVKALKEKLLYNGTGTLDGYTWDESEKITGDISIDDALDPDYEGTTLLKDNVITGVKDEVTGGPHTWSSAVLDASASSLSVGADTSLSLAGAANNGGKFVTNDDGSVADVELAAKSTLTLEGNGTVGDVKGGKGTLATQKGSVTAGKIDVDNISMQSGTLNAESVTLKDAEGKNSNVNGSTINVAKDMNVKDITLKGSALNIGGSLNVSGKLVADPTYVYADGGITLTGTGELNVLKDTVMINGTQAQGVTPSSSANLVLCEKS